MQIFKQINFTDNSDVYYQNFRLSMEFFSFYLALPSTMRVPIRFAQFYYYQNDIKLLKLRIKNRNSSFQAAFRTFFSKAHSRDRVHILYLLLVFQSYFSFTVQVLY